MKLLETIVQTLVARQNCVASGNKEWEVKHQERLDKLENLLPRGAGFDSGTTIQYGNEKQLVLETAFHHMDEHGVYDEWTHHTITIHPTFLGPDIMISGKDRNNIKDYILDEFYHSLTSEVEDLEWVENQVQSLKELAAGVKNIHTEHCCKHCGCKYGDDYCPVVSGELFQSFHHGTTYVCS